MSVLRLARVLRQQDPGDGLTMSQLSALGMIAIHEPIALGDLASLERVRPPTMTRVAASLVEGGYAERAVDDNDRRVARLRLTEKGRDVIATTRTQRTAFLETQLTALSASEREELALALPVLDKLAETER